MGLLEAKWQYNFYNEREEKARLWTRTAVYTMYNCRVYNGELNIVSVLQIRSADLQDILTIDGCVVGHVPSRNQTSPGFA